MAGPAPRASTHRRLALGEVGSTNAVALEAARAGDPGGLWVTAEAQSGGRGRRGRAWVSPPGNLYASLLLVDPAPMPALAILPLAAALGVAEAVAALCGPRGPAVAVKWPNDVLVAGAKCVGILLESSPLPDGRVAVVVGCGINLSHSPADTPYPATNLAVHGVAVDVERAFAALADSMTSVLAGFRRGEGFAEIRRRWLDRAVGLGQPCRVNLADRSVEGRFVELAEDGRLVLERSDGARVLIAAGDLFFGRSAPVPEPPPAG